MSFDLFCKYWNPPPGGRSWLYADHKHRGATEVGIRRLMILTPHNLITLLPTNQKSAHELITYPTTDPTPITLPLPESHQKRADLIEHQLPWTPCLAPCNKCCTLFHHSLVSVDWLYCVRASGLKSGSVRETEPEMGILVLVIDWGRAFGRERRTRIGKNK